MFQWFLGQTHTNTHSHAATYTKYSWANVHTDVLSRSLTFSCFLPPHTHTPMWSCEALSLSLCCSSQQLVLYVFTDFNAHTQVQIHKKSHAHLPCRVPTRDLFSSGFMHMLIFFQSPLGWCACALSCVSIVWHMQVCLCDCVSQPAAGMCWQCVRNSRVSGLKSQSKWIKTYFAFCCSA